MRQIGRPKKQKNIQGLPRVTQFSPRGKPGRPDEAVLTIEEYESLRLSDYEKRSQKEASGLINISQQHFSRILKRAHEKLADAIVNGKIIRILTKDYIFNQDNSRSQLASKPTKKPTSK